MSQEKLPVDCLIPAAGLSSRMGKWKLQIPLNNNCTILGRTVRMAMQVCERVIVVGGYRFDELKEMLLPYEDVILLENSSYESGMLSSIQRGLTAVRQNFFITPVDMPAITEDHYRELYAYSNRNMIVRPVYRDFPGHPIYCPFGIKERILHLQGERLIREFQHWGQIQVPWADETVILDLDTTEDLRKWTISGGESDQ